MSLETLANVRVAFDAHVAVVTLDRPPVNAQTLSFQEEIAYAFDYLSDLDEVRAIVLTGAGKVFCAGVDLKERAGKDWAPAERRDSLRSARESYHAVMECTKPVIAAINGPAVGIGATMTLPMDIRLASDSARFGFVFAARGIVPEAASSWFLPRLVGIQQALEWCYTARVFPAAEALDGGLVRSLHPPEDLLDAARTLATEIAANSAPVSVALTRQLMWKGLVADHPMEAHRIDSPGVTTTGSGADAREGITAFFEKRPPEWRQQVPGDLPDWFPWWDQPSFDS